MSTTETAPEADNEGGLLLPWEDPIDDEEICVEIAKKDKASFALPCPFGLLERLETERISIKAFCYFMASIALGKARDLSSDAVAIEELIEIGMMKMDDGDLSLTLLPPNQWKELPW